MALTWLSNAIHKPIYRNYTSGMQRGGWDGIILHVAASEAASLHGWFNNPAARASSHFYIRRDGTIGQYVSVRDRSWTSGAGSDRTIGIETQGMASGYWTDQQVNSIIRLIRELAGEFGFPIRMMNSSRSSERGIGWHSQGVPANYTQKNGGYSQTGGELWSSAVGKVCPGPQRISQIPGIVSAAASGGAYKAGSTQSVTPTPNMNTTSSVKAVDTKTVSVKEVQTRLKLMGFYGADWVVDGIDGDATKQAILAYQKHQEYHPNMLSDGYWGPLEEKHYWWVAEFQKAINEWKTASRKGEISIDGDFGPYATKLTRWTQHDNLYGAYLYAVQSLFGKQYSAVADGVPGPAFCRMLGISKHPAL